MKKSLLIISVVLAILLAIGAVSATDNQDDSTVDLASCDEQSIVGDADELKEESGVIDQQNILIDSNNQSDEVLREDNPKETPDVGVDNVAVKQGEVISIPFNVTNSKGIPISGVVNVTIYGENDSISKNVMLNNGSAQTKFNITEWLNIINFNGKLSISDLLHIINSSTNATNFNSSKINEGAAEICEDIDVKTRLLVDGCVLIINGIEYDTECIVDGYKLILNGVNFDKLKFIDGYNVLISGIAINFDNIIENLMGNFTGSEFNITEFREGWNALIGGLNLDYHQLLTNILKGVSIDDGALMSGLKDIVSVLGIGGDIKNTVSDVVSYLHLSLTWKQSLALLKILAGNADFQYILDVVQDIMNYNHLTAKDIFYAFSNVTDGFKFNISKIIDKITDPNFDDAKLSNALKNIRNSVKIDTHKILKIIVDTVMADQNFNSSKFINDLANITGFDSSKLSDAFDELIFVINSTDFSPIAIVDGIDKICHMLNINESIVKDVIAYSMANDVNIDMPTIQKGYDKIIASFVVKDISKVNKGLADIISSFTFNMSSINKGWDELNKAITYDEAVFENGLEKIIDGFGINISSIAGQLISKLGYATHFDNILAPGTYNITVRYLENDDYASSINDTAKLSIIPKKDAAVSYAIEINGYKVTVKGNVNPAATGLIVFKIGDLSIVNLISDGKTTFDRVLEPGRYNIEETYLGDANFNTNSTSGSFVVKIVTAVSASQVNVVYGNSKNMVVTLKDSNGNVVSGKDISVKLNGKIYTKTTNNNGQVAIAIPNLVPKTYVASIVFSGDDNYAKSTGSAKVVVSKATPVLKAAQKTFKSTVKTKKYAVTLKTNKNKVMKNQWVALKVNKKVYKVKTNSKGQAIFKITNLNKKGTFTTVVKYAGNSYYNAKAVKSKIVVK